MARVQPRLQTAESGRQHRRHGGNRHDAKGVGAQGVDHLAEVPLAGDDRGRLVRLGTVCMLSADLRPGTTGRTPTGRVHLSSGAARTERRFH